LKTLLNDGCSDYLIGLVICRLPVKYDFARVPVVFLNETDYPASQYWLVSFKI